MPKGKHQTRHQRLASARAAFMREQQRFDTLQAYFDRTQPKSREDFVGREHFGEYAGANPQAISNLYTSLVMGKYATKSGVSWNSYRIDDTRFGLTVAPRRGTPLNGYPKEYIGSSGTDEVIQVGSLLDAAPRLYETRLYNVGRAGVQYLVAIVGQLEGFIGAEIVEGAEELLPAVSGS